jgi:hypothetical protein
VSLTIGDTHPPCCPTGPRQQTADAPIKKKVKKESKKEKNIKQTALACSRQMYLKNI